jgi:bifunctional non-homologous end joining protein LigD
MARRDQIGIRLLTRNGHDWALRYPLIVEAVNRLKVHSCLIDGEAVACDDNGLAVFQRLRRKPTGKHVFLYAFDLLELDGQDLRPEPVETRKAALASLLRASLPGLRLNEHLAHDGESVFRHACKMGLEGIVSKRLGSRYRSGRSKDWLKFKNPEAPAVNMTRPVPPVCVVASPGPPSPASAGRGAYAIDPKEWQVLRQPGACDKTHVPTEFWQPTILALCPAIFTASL